MNIIVDVNCKDLLKDVIVYAWELFYKYYLNIYKNFNKKENDDDEEVNNL